MSFLKDQMDADRAIVEAIRDNPVGTALARLIVEGLQQARFTGFGEWDQARYVAHLALQAGWQPPVATEPETTAPRPFAKGDWVLVTLPAQDQAFERYSGKVGQIVWLDEEGGYAVAMDGGIGRDRGLRAVTEELTLVPAPNLEPTEAGAAPID